MKILVNIFTILNFVKNNMGNFEFLIEFLNNFQSLCMVILNEFISQYFQTTKINNFTTK